MAKISPVSIKYIIHANFIAEGRLEKPDVIGAIFGQTEGLLGSDLEMRELQKEGKIGRIDVDIEYENSKTKGRIRIPSALDKAETTIIGAAIETIERIGPTDSKIKVENIEDVRGNKRDYIIKRAKELLEQVQSSVPGSRDITDSLKESAKLAKLKEYGPEKLPAGDLSGEEIIVVEGRADVINLLKNNITNVIGMQGTKLPETIKKLSKEKTIILFVDGDRGGKLIVKNVMDNAEIDFVAFAPDGKEVEELTSKEIFQALRRKEKTEKTQAKKTARTRVSRNTLITRERKSSEVKKREFTESDFKKIEKLRKEIDGQKIAYFLNENLEPIARAQISSISARLARTRGSVFAIIIDGKVNSGIVRSAEKKGVQHLIAKNFAPVNTEINLISI